MASPQIRHATPSDYGRVIQHVNAWWGGREMAPMLPKLFFLHFEGTSFVAEDDDGKLVAFLIGFLSQTDPDGGVHPLRRRRSGAARLGLGRALYERFFDGRARRRPHARPLRHVARQRGVGRVPRVARLRRRERRRGLRRPGRGPRAVREAPGLSFTSVASSDDMPSDALTYHRLHGQGDRPARLLRVRHDDGPLARQVPGLRRVRVARRGALGPRDAVAGQGRRRARARAARRGALGGGGEDRHGGARARPRPRRRHRAGLARARRGRAGRRQVDAAARPRSGTCRARAGGRSSSRGRSRWRRSSFAPTGSGAASRSRSWPRPSSSPCARRSRRSGPDVCVIDSVQTLYSSELGSAPGSVGQVREAAGQAPARRQGARASRRSSSGT